MHHMNGRNARGRMSSLPLHHGQRRLAFGCVHRRSAQAPHCRACWQGHSRKRSRTPGSNGSMQMPQERWSPLMTCVRCGGSSARLSLFGQLAQTPCKPHLKLEGHPHRVRARHVAGRLAVCRWRGGRESASKLSRLVVVLFLSAAAACRAAAAGLCALDSGALVALRRAGRLVRRLVRRPCLGGHLSFDRAKVALNMAGGQQQVHLLAADGARHQAAGGAERRDAAARPRALAAPARSHATARAAPCDTRLAAVR